MRTVSATRYVTPLREGGSLPAIIEADDEGLYVLKFRGAGQGPKALIAELVCGELARAEPDPEIQSLIQASAGLNLALDYLPGSVMFDSLVTEPDAQLASAIVWFDAFTSNVDRTARNTNMLVWHRELWLIDHGAALYFHHSGDDWRARSGDAFTRIQDHVLLRFATALREMGPLLHARLSPDIIRDTVALIPEVWLTGNAFDGPAAHREAYVEYLTRRLQPPQAFFEEALRAVPV